MGDERQREFSLAELVKGRRWMQERHLAQKFCSLPFQRTVTCIDEIVLADDYDTNYSLLLSLTRTIEVESKDAVGGYLFQLHDWMCK